jgi:hypothetical protein
MYNLLSRFGELNILKMGRNAENCCIVPHLPRIIARGGQRVRGRGGRGWERVRERGEGEWGGWERGERDWEG